MLKCLNCNIDMIFKRMTRNKYCSISCQQEFQRKQYINRWKEGLETGQRGKGQLSVHVRNYLLEKYDNTCTCCKIKNWNDKQLVMEVEHIDGNSENNTECNLTLLCPNCHSQTETYKGANRGKGRHSRRVRYQEGKSY